MQKRTELSNLQLLILIVRDENIYHNLSQSLSLAVVGVIVVVGGDRRHRNKLLYSTWNVSSNGGISVTVNTSTPSKPASVHHDATNATH